jgi:hypothetical protein
MAAQQLLNALNNAAGVQARTISVLHSVQALNAYNGVYVYNESHGLQGFYKFKAKLTHLISCFPQTSLGDIIRGNNLLLVSSEDFLKFGGGACMLKLD